MFASVFTDLSRVELAKARAVSAADLSLNTILAHYDPEFERILWNDVVCSISGRIYEASREILCRDA